MAPAKYAAILPPRFNVFSSSRCGRSRWRRRSMDQKTRVAAKYRSNVGHGHYCCVPKMCSSKGDFAIPFLSRLSQLYFSPSSSSSLDPRHKMGRGQRIMVTSNMRVCSAAYFRESDYRVSAYAGTAAAQSCGRRNLVSNAVPSIFEWNRNLQPGSMRKRLWRNATHCHLRSDCVGSLPKRLVETMTENRRRYQLH